MRSYQSAINNIKLRRFFLPSLLIVTCSLLIASCGNPLMEQILEPKTVSFNSNGGSSVASQTLYKGQKINKPSNPAKSGFIFSGWYRDNNSFQRQWNFGDVPSADITLHARWADGTLTPITGISVNVTPPSTGIYPDTTATGSGNFTAGPVTWNPAGSSVMWDPVNDKFQAGTVYTATLALTADANFTFTGLTSATINGQAAVISNNTGAQVTLSYTFPQTTAKMIIGINIISHPNLSYTHGDTLDMSLTAVGLVFEDSTSVDNIEFDDFITYGITSNPAHGAVLSHTVHNNQPVEVSAGSDTAYTGNLSINIKALTITGAAHTKPYDGTTAASGVIVTLGGIVGTDDVSAGTVTAEYTNENAGADIINITGVTLTGNDAGNYTVTLPIHNLSVTGGIIKAAGAGVGVPAMAAFTATSITINTVAAPGNGQAVEYAIGTAINGTGLSAWQGGLTFTGLTAGTAYYVYARSAENSNYNNGTPSISAAIIFNTAGFTISVDQIIDLNISFEIPSGLIISRSGTGGNQKTADIIVQGAGGYSVQWLYDGDQIGTAAVLTLSVDPANPAYNIDYNIIGIHFVTVILEKDGAWYSKRIEFEVKP